MTPLARRRWRAPPAELAEKAAYRPGSLSALAQPLDAEGRALAAAPPPPLPMTLHTVAAGETLSKLARRYYGVAKLYGVIFEADREVLDNADELFVSDVLKIPPKPPIRQQ